MGQALEIGRQVLLTALGLLTDTRATYDCGPDQVKTLLTKRIFGKLYLNADTDGTVTVAHADLVDPFAAILDTTDNPTQTAPDPGKPATGDKDALSTRYGPWQTPHSTALRATASMGDHRPQRPAT